MATRPKRALTLTYTDRILDADDAKLLAAEETRLKQTFEALPLREQRVAQVHLEMMQREAFFVDLMDAFAAESDFVSLRFSQYDENNDSDDPADRYIFLEVSTDPNEEPEQHSDDFIVQLEQQINDMGRNEHWDFITKLMEADIVRTDQLAALADACLGADWNALRLQKRLDQGVPDAAPRTAKAPRM